MNKIELLQQEAKKATYSEYSIDKLSAGKFGIIECCSKKTIQYVLLSDRLYDSQENDRCWFYFFTGGCCSADRRTGVRHKYCRIVGIEVISNQVAKARYDTFLLLSADQASTKIDYLNEESDSIMEYTYKKLEDNKLTHELGAMLYALGDDILKRKIELKLDSTISEFYFHNHNELLDLCTKIYTYEIDCWKITRLCINLQNLLFGKKYLLYPEN